MGLFRKNNGAVSIFLVIILVPMLTISALFVDAGKVRLAKGAAQSAGDLALNTALTEYDTLLKDMYGLFATAQSTDELYEKLEDYYRKSITSADIEDEDADEYVDLIMSHLGRPDSEKKTSDILNMQLADFNVQKLNNANLANPGLLKRQVVDFMKYRSPINTGLSFLSSLQSFTNLSKETELVDKRKAYYEEQQTVMENAQAAWNAINAYNQSDFIKHEDYFQKMKEQLNSYSEEYKTIHTNTIKNLYDTQDYDEFVPSFLGFYEDEDTIGYDGEKVIVLYTNKDKTSKCEDYTKLETYSASRKASAEELGDVLEECNEAYKSAVEAEEELLDSDSDTYGLQFVVQTNRKELYENYVKAVKKYYECYQEVLCAFHFMEEGADKTEGKLWDDSSKSYAQYYEELSDQFEAYAASFNKKHSGINSELEKFAEEIGDKTSTASTNDSIVKIHEEICAYRTTLSDAKTNLEDAKECLNAVWELVKTGGDLDKAKQEWSALANNSQLANSSVAKQDKAEIKDLGDQFKQEDVKKLIDRCEKISAGLGTMIQEIDKFKYAGRSIYEISDYTTFQGIVGSKYGEEYLKNVPFNGTELNNKIDSWWNEGVFTSGSVDISWTNSDEAQVNFGLAPKLKFYTFLHTHFYNTVSEDVTKSQKDTYDNTKKALSDGASDKADTSQTIVSQEEIKGQPNLPSNSPSNKTSGATPSGAVQTDNNSAAEKTSESLSSMFSSLTKELVNFGTGLRDNLYYTDYVMSMFSYDTFEKEAKYDALPDEVKKNYQSVVDADTPSTAKFVSLTNNPISKDKNFAYGGEVEYIIYGGGDSGNKAAAYGSIFAIRLGFNLVYAFTDSEIREGALAVATPISAATLGVIPAPLIQAAIIIGVAIAESSIDLMCLREGMSVPLYKNKKTWNITFSNLMKNLGTEAVNLVKPAVEEVIDSGVEYLDSWLDKTEEELNNLSEEEIDKLGASVQASFETVIEREADIVMQKITTLIDNGIGEGVKNETDMVNYVSSKLDAWLASSSEDKSGIAYKAKEKAVAFIKESGGTYIKNIYNGITSAAKDIADSAVDSVSSDLNKILTDVRNEMQKKVTSMVSDTLDAVNSEIKGAVKSGADKLKETINSNMNKLFSGSGTGVETSGMSSMIAFQYSDYLRLFMLIGIYTNEEGVLLRTADVIQVNMAQKLTDNKEYLLSNSAAYVKIDATVVVKPTLIGLPLFADVEHNSKDNANWYTINYSDIKGY